MRYFLIISSFFLSVTIKAQTNEPTLSETIKWLKEKISTYCGSTSESMSCGFRTVPIQIDNTANLSMACEGTSDGGEARIISLYDVTGYRFDGNLLYLLSKEKKVRKIVVNSPGDSYEEKTNDFAFYIWKYKEEDNLVERIKKAVIRLVALNNKDKPKEPF